MYFVMKQFLLCSFFLFLHGPVAFAQQLFPTPSADMQHAPLYHIQLNEATVVASHVFSNDTDRYRYNQMKHYVKIVLPYANAAIQLFYEIEQATANMSNRNRRRYIRGREKDIKEQFEDKLSALNITQGRLLVKLINRQLKSNCYDIVRELKNPVTAAYYQGWAKLNGINLNDDYDPEKEPDLERIMRSLGY